MTKIEILNYGLLNELSIKAKKIYLNSAMKAIKISLASNGVNAMKNLQ